MREKTQIRVVYVVAVITLTAVSTSAMTCSIVSSFQGPAVGAYVLWNLDYYNGRLYHAVSGPFFKLYETTTTGSIISSFTIPGNIRGVEVGSDGVWMCGVSPYGGVFHYTINGSLIGSFIAQLKLME